MSSTPEQTSSASASGACGRCCTRGESSACDAAGKEHFTRYRAARRFPQKPGQAFRNIVYGELAFIKMIKGQADPVFLKLCSQLIELDPNPSKFLRQMVFGAADYDVFISHASEDKETIARPIYRGVREARDQGVPG